MTIKSKVFSLIITTVMALTGSMPCCFADVQTPDNAKTEKPAIVQKTEKEKKNEAGSVLKKFFISMCWVGGSCLVIFLILLAYKRLKTAKLVNSAEIDITKNLNSPETIEEATKFFIEKF